MADFAQYCLSIGSILLNIGATLAVVAFVYHLVSLALNKMNHVYYGALAIIVGVIIGVIGTIPLDVALIYYIFTALSAT